MRSIFTLIFILSLMSCTHSVVKQEAPAKNPAAFSETQRGCFLLYNLRTEKYEKVLNEVNCRERLPACSSFKVPLAVMAFDSGALKDENVVLKWDGKKDEREAVNQDHDAKTWMRDSVVWFSQRLTTKMGKQKTQKYLDKFNYGNRNLSAGLTEAWLVDPDKAEALKISAYEQAEFMAKLYTGKLPVSERALEITKKIIYLEKSSGGFEMSGKTGSNFYGGNRKLRLGWFIAHVQKGNQEYIAITQFSDMKPTEESGYGGFKAKALTKAFLEAEGLW